MISGWSRDVPIDPARTALLVIDVQNYTAHPHGGEWRGLRPHEYEQRLGYLFQSLRRVVVPNLRRLQAACRCARIEIMYTVIENLTKDGRDRSLDYKISEIDVAKGSWDARVLDEIMPNEDEIIFRKTASNVFVATNIDYVLRNLGTRHLIVCGLVTDQCVESAARNACDLGYLVTVVTDASTTYSATRHEQSLLGIRGYCRQRTTEALLAEIAELTGVAVAP
jgi:ureidoacrylate peracid hydrolase